MAVLLSLGLGGCVAEVAAIDVASPATLEAPALVTQWRESRLVLTEPMEDGRIDPPTRRIVAEIPVMWSEWCPVHLLHLRLRATVRARAYCPTGNTPEQNARWSAIDDGSSPIYLDFDQQVYLDDIVQELVDAGMAREHIETVTSDRIRVGPRTEYLRMHVLIDVLCRGPAPRDG